jgi:hypothetical protein
MKKQIITGLLFLSVVYTAQAAQNDPVVFDATTFAHEIDTLSTDDEYTPAPKPWYASLATHCAEHTPEIVMLALVTAYCYYDDFKEWSHAVVKPKLQDFIAWFKNKKKHDSGTKIES